MAGKIARLFSCTHSELKMSRAIFHIGTEKTGTTALQGYLAMKRDALAKHGFCYSKAAGKRNHLNLYLYASQGQGSAKKMIARLKKDTPSEAFERDFAAELEVEASENQDKTFVFSNEHCRGRLSKERVGRLHELLTGIFDRVDVIVYIRRQDELAVSRYSTMLKAGMTHEMLISDSSENEYFYDYWRFLDRWASVFGRDRLIVRLFEKGELIGDSVITDFCEVTGVPSLAHKDRRENPSLRPQYQEFLRQMNIRLLEKDTDPDGPVRARLMRTALTKLGGGRGQMPSRDEAEGFYRSFSESNERVRKRFFPERATLFNEDFSGYPEEAQPLGLDLETALDISAELWKLVTRGRQLPRDLLQATGIESGADDPTPDQQQGIDGRRPHPRSGRKAEHRDQPAA